MRATTLLLCLLAALGGCHLVDQRDFVADADKPPVVPVPPPAPPGPSNALVVIRFPAADDWRSTLGVAVGLARSRKPDVLFTVQSAVPRVGSPADQADALARTAGDARAVADAIVSDGADRSQVELTAQADAGLTGEEIRIFVR
jgi:hypothetical protein